MTRPFRGALLLAVTATGTAICLSVLAGWQRGGPLAERLVWVAIGMVLVVGGHLLPSLVRSAPLVVRGVAGVLWLACMATACYGHLTFFLLAQRHAGELRAGSIASHALLPANRGLTAVMADRAMVAAQLATANIRHCQRDCLTLDARRLTLAARLDALNAEADDIRRSQAAGDRVTAERDGLTADPVTVRLAALFGTTVAHIDLLSGLAFAAVLEGVACLLWTVTLRPLPAVAPVTPISAPVMTSATPTSARRERKSNRRIAASDPVTPSPIAESADLAVAQLTQAIAAGHVRPTVADIRRHLGCSQGRAAAVRRQLVSLNLTA
ncbi:hypothetical protein [Cupriavidus sp. DL-D2]|uniref:hypothetical protein n=1 Tax=Cupriavidus sp. DL-D2 TaxID=3144974 RepID=UPI003213D272